MKIKINGEDVEVEEGAEVDVEETPAVETPVEAPTEAPVVEEVPAPAEEPSIDDQAKSIGQKIADEAMKGLTLESNKGLEEKVDKLLGQQYGNDTKLKEILNGKDLFGGSKLTKEEKIVGFFHALMTDNKIALKALSEGTPADGGYLFPDEFLQEIVRNLPDINVMRNYVRVIPMKRNAMDITTLISGPQVSWTAENTAKSTTTARWGQTTLTAYKMAAILYSSDELIEDSDTFDVVQMIIGLFAEAVATEEENVIWNGTGTAQPTGINTARTAGTIASTAGTGVIVDDILDLYYEVPAKYRGNSQWFANSETMKNLEKAKDSEGRPLIQPSLVVGQPTTLKGRPFVISEKVPANQLYFGDLTKAYFLGDRSRMSVKISQDTTQAFTQDMTAIRVVSRIGGLVVNGDPVRAVITLV